MHTAQLSAFDAKGYDLAPPSGPYCHPPRPPTQPTPALEADSEGIGGVLVRRAGQFAGALDAVLRTLNAAQPVEVALRPRYEFLHPGPQALGAHLARSEVHAEVVDVQPVVVSCVGCPSSTRSKTYPFTSEQLWLKRKLFDIRGPRRP